MTAIEFNNISKQYRLGLVSTRTLSHDLNRWWQVNILRKEAPYLKIGEENIRAQKGESEYVWALKDISFKVEQGDVLGIIGKNGAGKSTLLKILSKVTSPTTGTIKARGRIASLLEVGTGFHPEMTGRENIYMNGAIMGMTKAEITRKLDEIVDFAGVERYIDTPVKRYSSGMTVRLGFAIAAHLEPEILVVDEVLAVGDAEFQKKAIGKMQDVSKGEGRTVLFVSHNMGSIRALCTNGILLENGRMIYSGTIDNVVDYYLSNQNNASSLDGVFYPDKNLSNKFKYLKIQNLNGQELNEVMTGDSVVFEIKIQNCVFDETMGVGLYFYNQYGDRIAGITSFYGDITYDEKKKTEQDKTIKVRIDKFPLTAGMYSLELVLAKKNVARLDHINSARKIHVIDGINNVGSYLGYIYLDGKWCLK